MRHIALEGRVFVLGCNMLLHAEDIPDNDLRKLFSGYGEHHWIHAGGSVIIDPNGEVIAGPMQEQEAVFTVEIYPRQVYGAKWMLDVAGHDARPDIFRLIVHREPCSLKQTQETPHDQEGQPGSQGATHLPGI